MKRNLTLISAFYLVSVLTGCNSQTDLATGQANSNSLQPQEMADSLDAPRVSSVQIQEQSLLIGGSNLSGVDQVSLENDTIQVDLRPVPQNDDQLVADAGGSFKSLGLVSGTTYSLILVDSTTQQSTKLEMTYLPQE